MDERTADFLATFQTFMDEVVHDHQRRRDQDEQALNPVLRRHLGADPRRLAVVTEEIPAGQFVDLDIALSEVQERADAPS